MRLSSSRHFRSSAIILAAFALSVPLAGCASYGSFDENEPGIEESLIGDFAGIIGDPVQDDPIDYSARAPLVVPPEGTQLRAPQEGGVAANDPDWPTDPNTRVAGVLNSGDQTLVFQRDGRTVDIAATQAIAAQSRQPPTRQYGRDGVENSRLTATEMQREAEIERSRLAASGEINPQTRVRERRFLTDPPVAARQPSPDAEYAVTAEGEIADDDKPWYQFW